MAAATLAGGFSYYESTGSIILVGGFTYYDEGSISANLYRLNTEVLSSGEVSADLYRFTVEVLTNRQVRTRRPVTFLIL